MKNVSIRILSAVLAALTLCTTPLSAEFTNTAGDWIYRTEADLDDIGTELYLRLSKEAAKGADGWLGNVKLAEDMSALIGSDAYGITVCKLNGSCSISPAENTDPAKAASQAVNTALGDRPNDIMAEINKTYAAFKHDHPECFWLSGASNSYYSLKYSYTANGEVKYDAVFYLVLSRVYKDKSSFDVRYGKYADLTALKKDIALRDSAVDEILSLPEVKGAKTTADTVAALSDALTRRNAYYSGSDVKNAEYMSHESLIALVGGVGANGPVCEGYAKAYKVLCDRVGITCATISGNSVNSIKKNGDHMWNAVMINGLWYAVDVTFNDPKVGASDKAVSGFENRDYVLVGSDTVIDGKRFSETHIPDKVLTAEHKTRKDAPKIYTYSYEKTPEEAYSTPFTDMDADDRHIYYGEIKYAWDLRRMIGVTDTLFAPEVSLTRGMIVTVLWRREGSPKVTLDEPFTDVPDDMWYTEAIAWAQTEEIVKGYGDGTFGPYDTLTREQAFKILQRYAYYKGYDAAVKIKYPSLSGYSYSDWAYSCAVFAKAFALTDRETALNGTAERCEIAAYLKRFDEAFGKGR